MISKWNRQISKLSYKNLQRRQKNIKRSTGERDSTELTKTHIFSMYLMNFLKSFNNLLYQLNKSQDIFI